MRARLQAAAAKIAARHGRPPSGPFKALRKLFVAPAWDGPSLRRPGWRRWKRGELIEFAAGPERGEEWGDVGYYVAQTWAWLWWLYALVTPEGIVHAAVAKYESRARGSAD